MKLRFYASVITLLLLISCNNKGKKLGENVKNDTLIPQSTDTVAQQILKIEDTYKPETTNAATAAKLGGFLRTYLKKDINNIPGQDRNFSFYEIDLNSDGKNEYFIKLPESNYCGSGGCTFVLVSNELKPINRFTVTRPPIFVGIEGEGGWKTLILEGSRENNMFIHLKWDAKAKRYPSNPSLIDQIEEAPSDNDYVMWDDKSSQGTKMFDF